MIMILKTKQQDLSCKMRFSKNVNFISEAWGYGIVMWFPPCRSQNEWSNVQLFYDKIKTRLKFQYNAV